MSPETSARKKKRILLIQCGPTADEAVLDRLGVDPEAGLVRYEAAMVPIACATIAALTPEEYDVDIWDEHLHGQFGPRTPLACFYDVVGVSVMFSYLAGHARALGKMFKLLRMKVVAGGPAVSEAPEDYRSSFDAVFVNEAEETWPQFLRDLEAGRTQKEYRPIEKPDMTGSPPPAYERIAGDMQRYQLGAVQTTRGCPFDCEFCEVIYLYGRRQRHKTVEQVMGEVSALEKLGSRGVFFTDDEFVGDPEYARQLLTALVPLNNSFRHPLWYFTHLTLNVSRDEELLALVGDANFRTVLIGIESLNKGSLRETGKHHNAVRDILRDIRHIQSYGIGLVGSFIVGFDNDDPGTFERLHQGIRQSNIPIVSLSVLEAYQNTKLWVRLRSEGRVATIRLRRKEEVPRLTINVTPKGMSRVELVEGYRDLCQKVYSWEEILTRIRGFVSGVTRLPRVREAPFTEAKREKMLADAAASWGLSPAELADIADTLDHTLRTAPELLPRVAYYIGENKAFRRHILSRFEGFERMLELERSGDLVPDDRRLVLPPSFAPSVAGIFPELFTRLARGLPDEQMIPEAMKHVFVDFIVRWGATFQKLEPQHHAHLADLCDRAVHKLGGQPASVSRDGEALLRDARRRRLLDAVLKDVRDELARVAA